MSFIEVLINEYAKYMYEKYLCNGSFYMVTVDNFNMHAYRQTSKPKQDDPKFFTGT